MSKRIMTKFNIFALAMIIIFSLNTAHTNKEEHLAQLTASCMAIKTNLPMNHAGHPCSGVYAPNQNIWSWLSGDSQSAHLHFLDLVELIQANLNVLTK